MKGPAHKMAYLIWFAVLKRVDINVVNPCPVRDIHYIFHVGRPDGVGIFEYPLVVSIARGVFMSENYLQPVVILAESHIY